MSSLQESLSRIVAEGKLVTGQKAHLQKHHPEAFILELEDDGNSISIKAIDADSIFPRFKTLETFFLEIRRKIRELTNDPNWNLRYASQIKEINLPFLHNGATLHVYIDPMLPYRNPIKALSGNTSINLIKLPSQIYYAKPKEEALSLSSLKKSRGQNGNFQSQDRSKAKSDDSSADEERDKSSDQ